ncbi:response regulator [Paenibacillus sp. YYML68]|uniref:response regulator transcription factor n=1 Tax=Paenibacillus sp. YYML68 TaxID=2909250 RepID=UPI002490A0B1|nr:response regulator [Paenibacillus sp. YYML68]
MLRVLIVDDEPMILKGLTTLLTQYKDNQVHIRTADNGKSALALILEQAPDIVLTDIRMPVMDGLELTRSVHELGLELDMIVISGYSDFEYARKCMASGVKDYLLKPVARQELYETLDRVLAQRQQSALPDVSAATLTHWAERLEQKLWDLRIEDLMETLTEWRKCCTEGAYSARTVHKLHTDLLELLVKKLQARGTYKFEQRSPLRLTELEAEAHEQLNDYIMSLVEELKSKRRGKTRDPIEEAKAYIDDNLSREIQLEEVAEYLGLHPSYFSQMFKQHTGETFVQYRIRRRMEKAKQLLEQPHYRITDISYEVGYADHPHFTKTFKKYTGYSPSEYRQKLGIE